MFRSPRIIVAICLTFAAILFAVVTSSNKSNPTNAASGLSVPSMSQSVPQAVPSRTSVAFAPRAVPSYIAETAAPVPTNLPTRELSPEQAATMVSLVALATKVASEPTGLLRKQDYGAWSYEATRIEGGELRVDIKTNTATVAGVKAFADANKLLAERLSGRGSREVAVRVIFKEPMRVDAYRKWAAASGITFFSNIAIRASTTGDATFDFSVAPGSGNPYPQELIDKLMKNGNDEPVTPSAVLLLDGKIPANRLPSLANDPNVFIVDVTRGFIELDLDDAGIDGAFFAYMPAVRLYDAMQTLGLVNFR